jgi:glycerol-3-phosphate acyltransferase PlsY
VLLAIAWQGALVFGAFWLAVAALTRYSSLASLVACAAVPLYFWLTGAPREALVFLLLAILIFVVHRANIGRLRQGHRRQDRPEGGSVRCSTTSGSTGSG